MAASGRTREGRRPLDAWSDAKRAGGASAVGPARARSATPTIETFGDRLFLAAVAVVFLLGCLLALAGPNGWLDVLESSRVLREHEEAQRRDLERLVELRERIRALESDPVTIERLAREKLSYVRPGEVTFVFPRSSSETFPRGAPPVGDAAPAD